MNDFKKHHKSHNLLRFLASVAGAVLLSGLCVVVVRAAGGMYQTFDTASQARAAAEGELDSLIQEYTHVSASLAAHDSPRGLEEAVRERFGVVKPGEGVIRIVRDDNANEQPTAAQGGNAFSRFIASVFSW